MDNLIIENEALPVNEQSQSVTIQRGKHNKEHPYVQISRKMLRDSSITPKAKGVLCYLLSLPDNWKAHPRHLALSLGVGKDQIYSVLKELINAGYATRTEIKGEKGKFSTVTYEFYEDKLYEDHCFKEKITVSGNPDTDNPDTGNQTLRNKESKENIPQENKPSLKVPKEPKSAEADSSVGSGSGTKTKREKPDFSPKVRELCNQLINIIVKYNPVYRPPSDLYKFLAAISSMIETDKQDVNVLIKTFEWAVSDNEERGDFKGWQGIICTNNKGGKSTNPAEIFKKHFSKIHSQMNSRPKRKFAPSSDDQEAFEKMKDMSSRAI